MVLGQIAIAGKSNEITAMPPLLRLPDIRGRIITADSRNLLITGPGGVGNPPRGSPDARHPEVLGAEEVEPLSEETESTTQPGGPKRN